MNSINVREKASVQEPERCCGSCCWFYAEDTDGYGLCPLALMEQKHCDEPCTTDEYVSKEEMRHYMAVLLQHNRWRRFDGVPNECKMVDTKELGKAIDFSVRYMKVFSKL